MQCFWAATCSFVLLFILLSGLPAWATGHTVDIYLKGLPRVYKSQVAKQQVEGRCLDIQAPCNTVCVCATARAAAGHPPPPHVPCTKQRSALH